MNFRGGGEVILQNIGQQLPLGHSCSVCLQQSNSHLHLDSAFFPPPPPTRFHSREYISDMKDGILCVSIIVHYSSSQHRELVAIWDASQVVETLQK